MNVRVLSPVHREIVQAANYLEEHGRLGAGFLKLVYSTLEAIKADPESFPLWEANPLETEIRRVILQRFSYLIFFQIVVDEIIVNLPFKASDVPTPDGSEVSLREALIQHYDIGSLNKSLIQKWQAKSSSPFLRSLVAADYKKAYDDFCWGRDLIDLVIDHPADFTDGEEFVAIAATTFGPIESHIPIDENPAGVDRAPCLDGNPDTGAEATEVPLVRYRTLDFRNY